MDAPAGWLVVLGSASGCSRMGKTSEDQQSKLGFPLTTDWVIETKESFIFVWSPGHLSKKQVRNKANRRRVLDGVVAKNGRKEKKASQATYDSALFLLGQS